MESANPEPHERPITLEDLATHLKLGRSTVGRALQGHPHVSARTKERVLAAARTFGYRPDPAVAALARRRWPSGAHTGSVTLALIYGGRRSGASGRRSDWFERIRLRARSRAASLGYHFDEFHISDYPSWHRLYHVLESRGIRGVVVLALREKFQFDSDWDRFASVFLGLPRTGERSATSALRPE